MARIRDQRSSVALSEEFLLTRTLQPPSFHGTIPTMTTLSNILSLLAQITDDQTAPGLLDDLRPVFLVLGAVFLGLFFLTRARKRAAQSDADRSLSAHERVERNMPGRDIYSQISELMAHLADLSREINGQIDTRIAKLEHLLRDADHTIQRLQAAAGQPSDTNPDATPDLIHQLRQQLNDPAPTPLPPAEDGPKGQGRAPQAANDTAPAAPAPSPHAARILDLAKQGLSPLDIARELNRPVGEIELVLSLNGQKPTKTDKNA